MITVNQPDGQWRQVGLSELGSSLNEHPLKDEEDHVCLICDEPAVHYALLHTMQPYDTYKIRRFHFEGETEEIQKGLTLEEAQEHCGREETHGEGWFDGYDKDRTEGEEIIGSIAVCKEHLGGDWWWLPFKHMDIPVLDGSIRRLALEDIDPFLLPIGPPPPLDHWTKN